MARGGRIRLHAVDLPQLQRRGIVPIVDAHRELRLVLFPRPIRSLQNTLDLEFLSAYPGGFIPGYFGFACCAIRQDNPRLPFQLPPPPGP